MSAAPGLARRRVVLAVGSNLGDRAANLQLGVDVLARGGLVPAAASGIFETAPVGGPEQPDYLNAVLAACTALPARQILACCAAAEAAAGRARLARWGPRTLDVDIISCGAETSSDPDLTLPHPRAHERAFVLVPWLDIDPDAQLPGYGPVAGLPAARQAAGLRRRPELALSLPGSGREAGLMPCR